MRLLGTVEFLASVGTLDRWLSRASDKIIVRISRANASLLLTSVRSPGSSVLAINIQRIGGEAHPVTPDLLTSQAVAQGASHVVPAQIVAHIKEFGDIQFSDGWAGFIGQKLWIEAFAIISVGEIASDTIEYCGVNAEGFQTPWLSNQMLCGSRGKGMPITGYAVRLKPEVAEHYDCTYTGKFVSGSTRGPFKDGELCRSDTAGDPLEGIELRVTERSVPGDPAGKGHFTESGGQYRGRIK